MPNYGKGLGVACKPISGFFTAWLFQSHLCGSYSLYAEAATLRVGVGVGVGVLNRGFQPSGAAWAGSETLD